jgi:hypothetical protein
MNGIKINKSIDHENEVDVMSPVDAFTMQEECVDILCKSYDIGDGCFETGLT